jgi:hypothetical protein
LPNSSSFSRDYKPSKWERLSASINALACTFVFDANTNIYCFFSVFREARRLRESVEQASILAIALYMVVFFTLLIDLILGLDHYISQIETLYLLFLSIPAGAFTCLYRPTKNSIMKRHVLNPKYLPHLDYAVYMLKTCVIKVILTVFIFYSIRFYYMKRAIEQFQYAYPADYAVAFQVTGTADLSYSD